MTSYAPLTAGLKHVTQTSELQPGQVHITRFKNALRNYRTDIWIGIILPEGFSPGNGLTRRPKGARPTEEGSAWTTPLNERVYPTYLPGRNLFRWTHISDLFILDKKPPIIYSEASNRPESHMFRKLLSIAVENPGLDFWTEMASKETQAKGRRGRELKLILPDSYDDSSEDLDFEPDDEVSLDDESSSDSAEHDDRQLPGNELQSTSHTLFPSDGGSSSRNAGGLTALSFPGESSSFLTYTQGGSAPHAGSKRKFGQASLETGSRRPGVTRQGQPPTSTGQPSSSQRVDGRRSSIAAEHAPKVEEEEERTSDVFSLNLRTALEHVFLKESDANDILAIFHDLVSIKNKPEFEQIRTWLMTREFKPRLVHLQVNDQAIVSNNPQSQGSDNESTQDREIGDIRGIHRNRHLEAVNDSQALRHAILSLGRLYLSIRHFAMEGLVELITLKLQVAWNSYPGISQLGPILDVAAMAFSGGPAQNDALRTWFVAFIADTQDLYFYDCSPRFWEVMRSNAVLHDEVFQKRTEMHRDHPERYADVRDLLRSRGIERY